MHKSSFRWESEQSGSKAILADKEGVEERILSWLSEQGIFPDEPTSKKYAYFNKSKQILSLSTRSDMDIELHQARMDNFHQPRHKTSLHTSFMDLQDSIFLAEISRSSLIMKRTALQSQTFAGRELVQSAGFTEEYGEPTFSKNLSAQE